MVGCKKGWIGIDLGTYALKLAQVERAGDTLRLAASAVMPRRRASATQPADSRQDAEWLGHDIAAALSLNPGFSGRRVACVLPMNLTDLNSIPIPPGEDAERRAMVAGELSSLFSAAAEDRLFDFWETDSAETRSSAETGSSGADNVNVLSIPHTIVSEVVQGISGAKLSCEIMDGLPFVLARAVKLAYPHAEKKPTAAVNWGFISGTFCVVSHGRPLFTRHLRNCGLAPVAENLSRALGLTQNEAMQLLATYGLPDADCLDTRHKEVQEVIAEVTSHPLQELVEELNKTTSFLRMQYPGMLPERLCLFGDGAALKNITSFLAEKTELPTEVWSMTCQKGRQTDRKETPLDLLGTAVALSTLAWAS